MKDLESRLLAELRRGVLQIAVLALMRERTYGYQLGKDLAARGLETEEGTLYPILRRLQERGLVESTWDTAGSRPRKYYEITPQGRETLEHLLKSWRGINLSLERLVDGDTDDEG